MKIFFPDNIFSRAIYNSLPGELKEGTSFHPSTVISKEVAKDNSSIGLIPTMDLITHKDLYVSDKFGISFESSLCNSYLYFKPEQEGISDVNLFGDITSLEVILGKILFKEMYGTEVSVNLAINENKIDESNVIIVGNKNFEDGRLLSGVSFSEEIIEILQLPFVNFIFTSVDKELLQKFEQNMEGISTDVYNKFETTGVNEKFSEEIENYIKQNISSLVIDFDSNDAEGISQLIRLPYFHGIIESMVDIKFT